MSNDTMIWLDRTGIRMTNLYGTAEDCQPGRTVEMLYDGMDRKDRGEVEWIKIRIDRPPRRSQRFESGTPQLALAPLFALYQL